MKENPIHISRGKAGEKLAEEYLVKKGFEIIALNYRAGRGEIDIIAKRDDLLLFVEVKSRKNSKYGHPEDFVNTKKAAIVVKTAECYILDINWNDRIRFDIIAITHIDKPHPELLHLEDAFY